MVSFKGRLSWRQYIPSKPTKYGIKVWVLADVSGYVYNCRVYCGENSAHEHCYRSKRDLTKSSQIVVDLITEAKLEHHDYTIYADNYFSTVPLVQELLDLRVFYTGTP